MRHSAKMAAAINSLGGRDLMQSEVASEAWVLPNEVAVVMVKGRQRPYRVYHKMIQTVETGLLLSSLRVSDIARIRYRFHGQTVTAVVNIPEGIKQFMEDYPLVPLVWREEYAALTLERPLPGDPGLATVIVYLRDEAMEQTEHEQWCVREVTGSAQQLMAGVLDKAGDLLKAAAKRTSEHADHPDNQNPGAAADLVRLVLETVRDDPPYDLVQLLKASDENGELPNFDFTLDDCRDNMAGLIKSLIKGVDDGSLDSDRCGGGHYGSGSCGCRHHRG